MKKAIALILAVLTVGALSSCDESAKPKEYRNDEIGLYYELPSDFIEYPYVSGNVDVAYSPSDSSAMVFISYFANSELMRIDELEGDLSLENYIEYNFLKIGVESGINLNVKYNSKKTRATFDIATAQSESEEKQYSYNLILKGEGGIYVIQMLCLESQIDNYSKRFSEWGAKIYCY